MNLPVDEAFECYGRLSAAKMPNLARVLERDLRVIEREDAASDIAIEPFIRKTFAAKPLFSAWTQPSNALTAEIFERIWTATDLPDLDTVTVIEQLRTMLPEIPELVSTCVPVNPQVARALQLSFATAETRYRWFGHRWTFEEYIRRYLTNDRSWIPLEGVEQGALLPG
uniref:Uncharacterized protein n=1 Tax=uncultured organism TaxID=155900 RepID=A0A7L9QCK8_9ZZZZ|nr:hypothetical protein [uncultured organism]